MDILKIEDCKGYYLLEDSDKIPVDKLNKEDLLKLLNFVITQEITMDELDDNNIKNKAHRIIYKNLFDKFSELKEKKIRFRDESESLYKNAIEKYIVETESPT